MRIDVHAHAFADKIAERAVAHLREHYRLPFPHPGTYGDLLKVAREARLDAVAVVVAATKASQVKPANDWILGLDALPAPAGTPRRIYFGACHAEDPDWADEVQRLRAAGIRRLKLHPELQGLGLDDPRLFPLFEETQDDFLFLIHMGGRFDQHAELSAPAKLARLLDRFPRLKVIAAHLGGLHRWDESVEVLARHQLWFDTSAALAFVEDGDPLLRRLVDRLGWERILMGSDYPLHTPSEAIAHVERKLPWLTSAQREAILGGNAAKLLGIG